MSFKNRLFRLLGKEPEAVVVSFLSGPELLARRMAEEVLGLVPDRLHYAVGLESAPSIPGMTGMALSQLGATLKTKRIGLAPVLLHRDPRYAPLLRAAFSHAPHKLLAYNERLERHHLSLRQPIASYLFWRGVPLDRIFLRPAWLFPFRRDHTVHPREAQIHAGRPMVDGLPRVAILSPYFPYPLSHGGAVRIYNLLREASKHFNLFLFAFADVEKGEPSEADLRPILDLCSTVTLAGNPRYREPHWSTWTPPQVKEFEIPAMRRALAGAKREHGIELTQVEYTQLASYAGDVLVEHDVTFDLYGQIAKANPSFSSRWNYWRWKTFEPKAAEGFRRVVVMSAKDASLLPRAATTVIPNGVDLERFEAMPETPGQRLLFIGSFRHFPNIVAYRFFTEHIWPSVQRELPRATLTVIAGPDPDVYWREHTAGTALDAPEGVQLLGFIRDVRPYYAECNLVVVPTRVSAGTNLKVLEAMAMERAILSTTSGAAGLGLTDRESVWIEDEASAFAAAIAKLLGDPGLRLNMARRAREHAQACFDWTYLGELQRRLWYELLPSLPITVRPGNRNDLDAVQTIQSHSAAASQWDPKSYLEFDLKVAELAGRAVGFLVSRHTDLDEIEILNLAVDPSFRRRGVAAILISSLGADHIFLEVRESNKAARQLYKKLQFEDVGVRKDYYDQPLENATVMRLSRKLKRVKF